MPHLAEVFYDGAVSERIAERGGNRQAACDVASPFEFEEAYHRQQGEANPAA